MKRNRKLILIGIILIIALSLRLWGINFGLPYIYHPDEPGYVAISQNMLKTGDLNPHVFNYPSLFFYLNTLAYIPYYFVGNLTGTFENLESIPAPIMLTMGTGQSPRPSTFLLERFLTVAFGCGVVVLVFLIGRRLTNNSIVGLLAALITAISPTNVTNSRYITPDTFLAFFVLLAFWEAVQVFDKGDTRHYVLAGIAIGLVASTKYNGALIVIAFVSAHFLRSGVKGLREFNLYLALIISAATFFATTPFALLDHQKFLADLEFERQHYSTGHSGMEGNSLIWYLTYMWQTAGVIYIVAVLEILRGIYFRSKKIVLLSVFPLTYFIFISSFVVRNDRTLLPLTPFMFLLAASFLIYLWGKAKTLQPRILRRFSIITITCLLCASLISPTWMTITNTIHLTTADSRETARIWINKNLPSGTKIAIESYSPFVDPVRFSVQGLGRMIDFEPAWYIEQGFDYMVFSQGMYGRFYLESDQYPNETAKYDHLFTAFDLLKKFTDGGYEIRIYRVAPR